MTEKRTELKFQGHIIDSYKVCGGHAKKWATDLTVGNPDLICSLTGVGTHLCEVKHRPEWRVGQIQANPLTPRQILECKRHKFSGGSVFGMVVVGETKVLGSYLVLFDPIEERVSLKNAVPYVSGRGYAIRQLMEQKDERAG